LIFKSPVEELVDLVKDEHLDVAHAKCPSARLRRRALGWRALRRQTLRRWALRR
jgi:hypothetical protein